ncbi:MAG TPA: hypothetical protein VKV74_02375 [Bryobacteraceae bacterium]|nr:hypothetical protein [Bryobacteraceae bacterium]
MHHFGEDMTTGRISDGQFIIQATHHATGAVVTMTGPLVGVLADPNQPVDENIVNQLARQFARFLRTNLNSGPAVATA